MRCLSQAPVKEKKPNKVFSPFIFRIDVSFKLLAMTNKEIASYFKLIGQLMELHDDNKFKAKSYANASFQIGRFPRSIKDMPPSEYETIPGMGKNLAPKLQELMETGQMTYLNQWLEQTPKGVIEMLQIKGLGPSKIRAIWKEMEIESPGELLYACEENRLIDLKGFGEKTQEQVKEAIGFMMNHRDKFIYASVEGLISEIKQWMTEHSPGLQIMETGQAIRRAPVLDKLEFVVTGGGKQYPETAELKIPVIFHEVAAPDFEMECFRRSAAEAHLAHLKFSGNESTAEQVYQHNSLPFIVPEMREGLHEFEWSEKYSSGQLVADNDLKGCLHNHSTYSDGVHTLEDMALYLRDQGYEYLGICDHSKTAVYANGLSEARIIEQHREIEALNMRLHPFRIFKGIESDILPSGALDYTDEVLTTFDFVVASVHSAMKMDADTATARLIKAIENPYTTILGHPTGRLLLSRPGYPIHHQKVIDACAANGVAIELNANPMRLDIDWTWVPYCMEKGVKVSINPDAHRKEGFHHMSYGVLAARKGGLIKAMTLNTVGAEEIAAFFAARLTPVK